MSLNELASEIYQITKDHGFWEGTPNFGEQLALVHSEVSETLEDWRHGRSLIDIVQEVGPHSGKPKPAGVPIELADIIIRVLNLCGGYGIDIDEAVALKIAYNKERPYRHGNLLA